MERKSGSDFEKIKSVLRKQIDRTLQEKKLGNLEYSITETDNIPVDPATGKSRLVLKEF